MHIPPRTIASRDPGARRERDGDEVEIGSRNERPMTRYFPELVAPVNAELPERCVIDGEIVVRDAKGRPLDFEALQPRIQTSASRVELLSAQTPARDTRSTAQPGWPSATRRACTARNATRSTKLRAASSAAACSWPACARSRQTYC